MDEDYRYLRKSIITLILNNDIYNSGNILAQIEEYLNEGIIYIFIYNSFIV